MPETLAQVFFCEFCEISKNTFSYRLFSLTNVGLSDTGVKKMNAVKNVTLMLKQCALLIFDVRTSKEVESKFYNMCPTTGDR